jgi:hypothetical protein
MRPSPLTRTLTLPALLLLAALPAACKTAEGHDMAAETADQVLEVGGDAGQTQLYLDKTLDSLEKLSATGGQDPMPAYKAFSSDLASFKSEFDSLRSGRADLRGKAETWFTEFEKRNTAIQDEDLRETGAKRLAEFRDRVAETTGKIDELVEATNKLELRLGDLKTYLGNDLTADGIKAVSGRIEDLSKDGRKIAVRMGELSKASVPLAEHMRAARKPAPAEEK